ncbi:MAG: hypothetical protein TR69_WS6001000548 [candidate division WS6 bacterium OLB20]|uniref:Alpha/beta hydrolase family protein n=1 Tax=candidate division WS6 bacterium OLB20 TaxID=1617426 RepID=A0A136LY18_9BACT|nr:MAG: hypothetical protein TR69_WS6001000548 [candidate division WS6 bacterium OLB20]
MKIIFAGNYNMYDQWKDHLEAIRAEHQHVVIEGASHTFVEPGISTQLFAETHAWLPDRD